MADRLEVNPEHLFGSAVEVDGHAEDVFAGHAACDSRIGSAEPGWTGLSAAALTEMAARWQQTTTVLGGRIAGHAESLRGAGFGFADMEQRNADALRNVHPGRA